MTSTESIWSPAQQASDSLEVYLLGLVDFESAVFLQERLAYEISGRDDAQGGLLICEHPPMVTIGREGSRSHLLAEPGEFIARQMETRWLNRGGGCVVHAPGQLAVYPIVPLDRLGLGLSEYRHRLEQSLINTCGELHVPAYRRDDEAGVFSRIGQIGFIGASVRSWVSMHGMFVNVCPQLEMMRMVQSNHSGIRISSLSAERMRPVAMHSVRASLIRSLAQQLGYDSNHMYTGHPLLRRTKRRVYDYA